MENKFGDLSQFANGGDVRENILNSLFQDANNTIREESIQCIANMSEERLNELFHITKDELKKFCEHLDVSPSDLYYEPGAFIHPVCYLTEYEYFGFPTLDLEGLKFIHIDQQFKQMRKIVQKYVDEGNFEHLFIMIDKKMRFQAYEHFFEQIPDNQKYRLFLEIYSQSEYGFSELDPNFFRDIVSYRKFDPEYKPFKKLCPEFIDDDGNVTIYRGIASKSTPIENAYSWTLNKEVAKWFANRFSSNGTIYEAVVNADNIIDYNNYRNEEEVLVFYEDLEDVVEIEV